MREMNLEVFDLDTLLPIGNIVDYDYIVLTEEYQGLGAFEMVTTFTDYNMSVLKNDNILQVSGDDIAYIILEIKPVVSKTGAKKLQVKGTTLNKLLNNRIVWEKTQVTDMLISDIQILLLEQNFINPTNIKRKDVKMNIGSITSEVTEVATNLYYNDKVFDIIYDLCVTYDLGFSIKKIDEKLYYTLYKGKNKTKDATKTNNEGIVLSVQDGDLTDWNYYKSTEEDANVIKCEMIDYDDNSTVVYKGEIEGIRRKEAYKNVRYEKNLSTVDLIKYLEDVATTELEELKVYEAFDGSLSPLQKKYTYGIDFSLGDKVTIDLFGILEINATLTAVDYNYGSGGNYMSYVFGYDRPELAKKINDIKRSM